MLYPLSYEGGDLLNSVLKTTFSTLLPRFYLTVCPHGREKLANSALSCDQQKSGEASTPLWG